MKQVACGPLLFYELCGPNEERDAVDGDGLRTFSLMATRRSWPMALLPRLDGRYIYLLVI